jgi:hypothetical protein
VVTVRPIVKRVRLVLRETADDDEPIPEWRQRTENRRQLERPTLACRGPVVDAGEVPRDAVRHVDEAEAPDRIRCSLRHRHAGGHHRVEQRQREGRADAPQERSPR